MPDVRRLAGIGRLYWWAAERGLPVQYGLGKLFKAEWDYLARRIEWEAPELGDGWGSAALTAAMRGLTQDELRVRESWLQFELSTVFGWNWAGGRLTGRPRLRKGGEVW